MRREVLHFPVLLLFFVLGTSVLADEGSGEIKCFPEGRSLTDVQGDQVVDQGRYTVPRKQVLMEITTATW
jgi:hypothetical protein